MKEGRCDVLWCDVLWFCFHSSVQSEMEEVDILKHPGYFDRLKNTGQTIRTIMFLRDISDFAVSSGLIPYISGQLGRAYFLIDLFWTWCLADKYGPFGCCMLQQPFFCSRIQSGKLVLVCRSQRSTNCNQQPHKARGSPRLQHLVLYRFTATSNMVTLHIPAFHWGIPSLLKIQERQIKPNDEKKNPSYWFKPLLFWPKMVRI